MQAPVVNASLTALQDWTRRTAAVGWALAYLHEQRASNTDTGAFPSVAPPNALLTELPVSLRGSSLSGQRAANRLASLRFLRLLDWWATVPCRYRRAASRQQKAITATIW